MSLQDRVRETREKYVEARLEGKPPEECKRIAGYGKTTEVCKIEQPGGAVHNMMLEALRKKGMEENWLADQYKSTIDECSKSDAREKDLNAKAQLLKQLGFLMGYGKKDTPTVAVQINNQPGHPEGNDFRPTRELIERVEALVEVLEADTSRERSAGVHDASPQPTDSEAHQGVVGPPEQEQAPGGGGQP